MARTGTIVVYSSSPLAVSPRDTAASLSLLVESNTAVSVIRYAEVLTEADDTGAFERVAERIPMNRALDYLTPGWTYTVRAGASPVLDRLRRAILGRVPREVNENYAPTEIGFSVGRDVITIPGESEDAALVARTTWQLFLLGDGVPRNWPECRRLIGELPELHALIRAAASALSPAQWAVFWDI